MISPVGSDPATAFDTLMQGRSAIREVTLEGPNQHSNIAAPVSFNPAEHFAPDVRLENLDRVSQLTLAAGAAAVTDSGVTFTDENRARSGVSFGSGMAAANALEETFRQALLRLSTDVAGSRFPVGSSARRISGRFTNARAIDTRCCSPPDSSFG